MDSSLTALLAFLESRRPGRQPLVLATIVATAGSTYRKPGARMLIDSEGTACGLLSGGCLESDQAAVGRLPGVGPEGARARGHCEWQRAAGGVRPASNR